jgi:hypothetical protein
MASSLQFHCDKYGCAAVIIHNIQSDFGCRGWIIHIIQSNHSDAAPLPKTLKAGAPKMPPSG